MRFYGREEEIRLLRKELDLAMRNKAGRLAVVCGRRRIGKTSLIMKAFESVECPVIYLFAGNALRNPNSLPHGRKRSGKHCRSPISQSFQPSMRFLNFSSRHLRKVP